jgi:hypothetical protein
MDPMSVMDSALELLGRMDNSRVPWHEKVRSAAQYNRDLMKKRNEAVVDETVQGLLEDRRLVNRNPQIVGTTFEAPKEEAQ